MAIVEHRLRVPSGWSWFAVIAGFIGAGEAWAERQAQKPSQILGIRWSDSELAIAAAAFALTSAVGLGSLLWKRSKRPRLCFHDDHMSSSAAGFEPRISYENLRVRVTYYSPRDQDRGRFKRLELYTPAASRILLFEDTPRGEQLVEDLRKRSAQMAEFREEVEVSA